jgi:hypothetical protein
VSPPKRGENYAGINHLIGLCVGLSVFVSGSLARADFWDCNYNSDCSFNECCIGNHCDPSNEDCLKMGLRKDDTALLPIQNLMKKPAAIADTASADRCGS